MNGNNIRGDKMIITTPKPYEGRTGSPQFNRANIKGPITMGFLVDHSKALDEMEDNTALIRAMTGASSNDKLSFIRFENSEVRPNTLFYKYLGTYGSLESSLMTLQESSSLLEGLTSYLSRKLGGNYFYLTLNYNTIQIIATTHKGVAVLGTRLESNFIKSESSISRNGGYVLVDADPDKYYIPMYYPLHPAIETVILQYLQSVPYTTIIDALVLPNGAGVESLSEYTHLASVPIHDYINAAAYVSPDMETNAGILTNQSRFRMVSILLKKRSGELLIIDPMGMVKLTHTLSIPYKTRAISHAVMLAESSNTYSSSAIDICKGVPSDMIATCSLKLLTPYIRSDRTTILGSKIVRDDSSELSIDYYKQNPVPNLASTLLDNGMSLLNTKTEWGRRTEFNPSVPMMPEAVNSRMYETYGGPFLDAEYLSDIPPSLKKGDDIRFVDIATTPFESINYILDCEKKNDASKVSTMAAAKYYGLNMDLRRFRSPGATVNPIGALSFALHPYPGNPSVPSTYKGRLTYPFMGDNRNMKKIAEIRHLPQLYDKNLRHLLNDFCKKTGYDTIYVNVPMLFIISDDSKPQHSSMSIDMDKAKQLIKVLKGSRVLAGKKIRIVAIETTAINEYKWAYNQEIKLLLNMHSHATGSLSKEKLRTMTLKSMLLFYLNEKEELSKCLFKLTSNSRTRASVSIMEMLLDLSKYEANFVAMQQDNLLAACGFSLI